MIKGISEKEKQIIFNLLKPYPYKFYAYGSRVKGDYTALSDLDILIKGNSRLDYDIIENLKNVFDNSSLPYVVNFTDYYNIDDRFYNLIKNDLTEIN